MPLSMPTATPAIPVPITSPYARRTQTPIKVYSVMIPATDKKTGHGVALTRVTSTYKGTAFAGCGINHQQVFIVKIAQGEQFPILITPKSDVECKSTVPIAVENSPEAKQASVQIRVVRP